MKKLVLAAAIAALPLVTTAQQLSAGTLQLSGGTQLSFTSGTIEFEGGDEVDVDTRSLNLGALYYVAPQLGIGLAFDHEYSKLDAPGFPSTESTTTVIGPMVGLNLPVGSSLAVFVDGAIGLARMEEDDLEADGLAFGLGAGLRIFPARWASFDLGLRYQKLALEFDGGGEVDTTTVSVGAGISVYLGGR